MEKIFIKVRKYFKPDAYVELVFDAPILSDISQATYFELVKMLWEMERVINENSKVRCHISIEEVK